MSGDALPCRDCGTLDGYSHDASCLSLLSEPLQSVVRRARDEIRALALGPQSGGRRFKTCVPVQPTDSDVILDIALRHLLTFGFGWQRECGALADKLRMEHDAVRELTAKLERAVYWQKDAEEKLGEARARIRALTTKPPDPPATTEHAGWIGVDLDGTLAHYEGFRGLDHIGAPIPAMVERVQAWIADGRDVRIFTARGCRGGDEEAFAYATIAVWCEQHLGRALPITRTKDKDMHELWDDRAVQVVKNTGRRADGLA